MKKINWNAKNVVNLNEYPYDNIFGECGTAGDGIDIVFGDSVEKIPDYLFNSATISSLPKIKSVTILENVPEIEVNAFSDCPISVTLYTGTESEWKEAYIGIGNDTLTENVIFNAKKKNISFCYKLRKLYTGYYRLLDISFTECNKYRKENTWLV